MSWLGKIKIVMKARKLFNRIRKEAKMGTKWYLSKTNWVAFIGIVSSAVAMFAPESGAAKWLGENSDKLLGLIGTCLILFRNIWTKTPTEA